MPIIYNVDIFATNYNKNAMYQASRNKANNTVPTTKKCIKTFKQAHHKKVMAKEHVFRPPSKASKLSFCDDREDRSLSHELR